MLKLDPFFPLMRETDWTPESAYNLGIMDARWLGHKDPNRSFDRSQRATDPRTDAYFEGLRIGTQVTEWHGIVTRCEVHWDNPGFNTPKCLRHPTHVGIAHYGGRDTVHLLCEKHAAVAIDYNRKCVVSEGKDRSGFPEPWDIIPISWL